jgi:hypothetical protein
MKDIVVLEIHLEVTAATLLSPGGMRTIVPENYLLKHALTVLCCPRKQAPNLSTLDRFPFGFGSLLLKSERVDKLAIVLRPSTLLEVARCVGARKVSTVVFVKPPT